MLSSKKLKPYIFSGGIFLFLAIVIVIVNASTPALALDVPTVSNLSTRSLPDTAASIINAFVGLVGVIALGIFVYGGYVWMTSGGIPQRIALAKRILLSAVIGFIIILTSWAIVNFIIEGATGDEGGPGGACTEGSVSGCYDCVGGSWVYDNTNVSCGFGDLFTVKWVDPKNGDANIPLCRIIQAGFSKNVNTATVTSANVTIQMSCANDNSQCLNVLGGNNLGTCSVAGNTRCSGNIAALLGVQWNYFDALSDIDSLPDAFEFIPPAEWEKNRTYRIEMTTAVASLSGTALSGTFVSTFSTGSTTDNTAPQVASIVPDGSAVPVCRMKPISAVFNEPMRASSLKDAATLSVADPDYASLEISKADGSISPDGLSFSSFIPDPLSVIYSPNKPYDKNTAYYPILRAGEDTDGNKKIEGAEDKNGNGQPDGIQDACLNFLDQTSGDGLFGSPFGDYGDSPVDADDSPVDYSFTTEDSDDLQCDPEILNIVPIPAYYDAPTEIITLTGKNFGNTGEVKLKDSISVNFANNLCLNNASVPPNTDTGKTCLAAWNDASITLIAPARTQASGTLDGTIDGPVQVNLGGIGVCDLGGTNKCLNGINSGNVCTSNNDCPAGLSNIMSVDIASPH
ncbi:MAG: hypothetical protein UX39_C0026G0002 [Candidatus Magasanikbacteria bacterium GW2011_GWA2_46_17]|uniref:SbsA Ig-like domain-containing protein n=1 Tax=Candidatus Magasanikbacteria bacterium GW2011_GWA2_46_17 TaxID=1619042 RepID=A0A0G1RXC5_9BACT|nr:MAG: hypothetical protein UX39_C0026G0002 [Candidatus Magasanikbacteria bacterium GW2011_GWA2_46_17]